MSTWCCDWFQNLLKQDCEKGYSIFASKDHGEDHFCLQACPFEKEVVEEFSQLDPKTGFVRWPRFDKQDGIPIPFVTAIYMPLTFCLRCGTELQKLIKENQTEFNSLVEQHIRNERKR
jgi:hypothetical protein